jgi:hypothetical protein
MLDRSFARPIRSVLVIVAAATLFSACAAATDPSQADLAAALASNTRGRAVVADSAGEDAWPKDAIAIDAARIEGDSLVATVSHGGGCAKHAYQLVVSTLWMESFPVQVPARLSHDAHGDLCKALLRRELRISLEPLANAYRDSYQQPHGSVSIRLNGTDASLLYTF